MFSNKADALCGGIIAHYFGTGRFDAVRGNRPGVPTKPDPTGLYALMTELGADPAATLFVGDSDARHGRAVGLPRPRRADRRRCRCAGRGAGGYPAVCAGAE